MPYNKPLPFIYLINLVYLLTYYEGIVKSERHVCKIYVKFETDAERPEAGDLWSFCNNFSYIYDDTAFKE